MLDTKVKLRHLACKIKNIIFGIVIWTDSVSIPIRNVVSVYFGAVGHFSYILFTLYFMKLLKNHFL